MQKNRPTLFIGIDVQVQRPCAWAAMDEEGRLLQSGWHADEAALAAAIEPLAAEGVLHIGIDAPRGPLPEPRKWYWDGKKKQWRAQRQSDRGLGRHCEVAVRAMGLANPQWTPLGKDAPEWMRLGFRIFNQLDALGRTYEAFPSAAYRQLEDDASLRITVDLSALRPGPKDMLDAWTAAATVREFIQGRGCEVGGGDGLGTIILPRPVTGMGQHVLDWPV